VMIAFIITLMLGYEKSLYDLYPMVNLASFGFLMVMLPFFWGRMNHFKNEHILIVGVFLVAIFSSLIRVELGDIFKYSLSLIIVVFYIFYLNADDIERFLIYIALGSVVLSLIGVLLFLLGFDYGIHNQRLSSFIFDPNYTAVLSGYGFLFFCISSRSIASYKIWTRFLFSSVCLISMLLTYSKGGVVAVLIALYLNYFIKKDFVRLISSVALFAFFVFAIKDILFEALSGFELFRVDMGLNLRDIYAVIALEGIGESPIFGNGVSAIKDAIALNGFGNSSFHNYYLEAAFVNGVLYLVLLLGLLALSFWRSFTFDTKTASLNIFFLALANNFSFAIGGVGLISVIFTILTLKSLSIYERSNTYS